MEIGAAAASLLIGWPRYRCLLKRMMSLGALSVPLLFGLILAPAPDQQDDPDNPYVLTLHDRQEA